VARADYNSVIPPSHGPEVSDLFMSLIHTCELNGVNPFARKRAPVRTVDQLPRLEIALRSEAPNLFPYSCQFPHLLLNDRTVIA
jgi:hypothetical protein